MGDNRVKERAKVLAEEAGTPNLWMTFMAQAYLEIIEESGE
jgi:hypothetical protein